MAALTKHIFGLQFHVTPKCDNRCSHCYVTDERTYRHEIENQLNSAECYNIIDNFADFTKKFGINGRVYFTGGDPLLREDFLDLLEYTKNNGLESCILGNPNRLDYEMAEELKNRGVFRYQISIDGLEDMHDKFRGRKGLFKKSLEAIKILNDTGIRSVVMTTVGRYNAPELPEIIETVTKAGVKSFDFSRLVPIGRGKELEGQMLSPQEYRSLLIEVDDTYRRLRESGFDTYFGRKDHLWKLLYQEKGLFNPEPYDGTIYAGCGMGWKHLTVLSDGSVLPCRRLPIVIGKVPEQSFEDIFLKSEELNKIREVEKLEKCRDCDLLAYCRGCPAVAYGLTGNYFSPDPQCWKITDKL